MKKIFCACALSAVLVPCAASAKVFISEVAWMGTSASANAEWMELGNDGDESISLEGYVLQAEDGQPKVTLKGSIAAHGYFLLERTSDASVPAVAADQIYSGSLGNDGELMILSDTSGMIVDRVDGKAGWKIDGTNIAGNNTTKDTAQLAGGIWGSGPGTPRAANAVSGTPPADTSGGDTSGTATTTSSATTTSQTSGTSQYSTALSSHSDPEPLGMLADEPDFSIGAGRDRLALVGSPILFRANIRGNVRPELNWSFGDGVRSGGAEATHSYYSAGIYDVVLDGDAGQLHGTSRLRVRVVDPDFEVSMSPGGGISIANGSAYEANLSGWQLVSGGSRFTFPRDTIIAAESSIVYAPQVTGLSPSLPMELQSPLGTNIVSFGMASSTQGLPVPAVTAPAASSEATSTIAMGEMLSRLAYLRSEVARIEAENAAPAALSADTAAEPQLAEKSLLPSFAAAASAAEMNDAGISRDSAPAALAATGAAESGLWLRIRDFIADFF